MKQSKSMTKAVEWVQTLVNHLEGLDHMDKRTCTAVADLLRAGCAYTVYDGNEFWDKHIFAYPDLDMGEALLHLSNRAAWNAGQPRKSLEDIYKEHK